jgi:hypothetical protein
MYKAETIIKSYDVKLARALQKKLGALAQVESLTTKFGHYKVYEDFRVVVFDKRVRDIVEKHLNESVEWTEKNETL